MHNTFYNIQLRKFYVDPGAKTDQPKEDDIRAVVSLAVILSDSGYHMTKRLFQELLYADKAAHICQKFVMDSGIQLMKKARSFHDMFFYKGFPESVQKTDFYQLALHALIHYATDGTVMLQLPEDEQVVRLPNDGMDQMDYVIDLMSKKERYQNTVDLLRSKTVWTEDQYHWLTSNTTSKSLRKMICYWGDIPVRVNACRLAGAYLHSDLPAKLIHNQKDMFRMLSVTYLEPNADNAAKEWSSGQVLGQPTIPRRDRCRILFLMEHLAKPGDIEDMKKDREGWLKLGRFLHPGEFKQFPKTLVLFQNLREKNYSGSYHTRVEAAFEAKDAEGAVSLLSQRPGEYLRSLNHLLMAFPAFKLEIVLQFNKIATKCSVPALISLWDFLHQEEIGERVFIPKGKAPFVQKAENYLPEQGIREMLSEVVETALLHIFEQRESLGKVWIDPVLKKFRIPHGQTSTSHALKALTRGTKIDIPDHVKVLRAFSFWTNERFDDQGNVYSDRTDLDLSAVFYDANFRTIDTCYYGNPRNDFATHSGDIVDAPEGAAEYLDIELDILRQNHPNIRYGLLTANVYAGSPFSKMPCVSAGWMERSNGRTGEVWDPKTVKNQFSLNANTTAIAMVMIDFLTREIVWLDMPESNSDFAVNNVKTRSQAQNAAMKSQMLSRHMSLYELAELHVRARGELVEHREDADTVIAENGTLDPYDMAKISAELL